MKTIIGIDPGLSGGIAILRETGLTVIPMPTLATENKRELDEYKIAEILFDAGARNYDISTTYIEHVGPMPKQGVTSMFTFGCGWGLVRGIIVGLGGTYRLVRPQAWKKVVMAGYAKGSESVCVKRLFPHVEFRASERCRVPHDGMVDAALIAEYGRRQP